LAGFEINEWAAYAERIGCKSAELTLDYPNNPAHPEVKDAILGLNLEEIALHAPFVYSDIGSISERHRLASLEDIRETAELARQLDAKKVTVHPGSKTKFSEREGRSRRALGASFALLDKVGLENGVRIAIENMPFRPRSFLNDNIHDLDSAKKVAEMAVEHENIGFCLDVGHARTTENCLTLMEVFKKRIWDVHLHDSDGANDHKSIGKGTLDFERIIPELKRHYKGTAFLENVDETGFEENKRAVMLLNP